MVIKGPDPLPDIGAGAPSTSTLFATTQAHPPDAYEDDRERIIQFQRAELEFLVATTLIKTTFPYDTRQIGDVDRKIKTRTQ